MDSLNGIDAANFSAFQKRYADAELFVVAQDVDRPYLRSDRGLDIRFTNLAHLLEELTETRNF